VPVGDLRGVEMMASGPAAMLGIGEERAIDRTPVMVVWFEDDDPRYPRWLAAHPDAFVLSTYRRPAARNLVLHRAGCPRVSRPLPTAHASVPRFGKACAASSEALRIWAAEVTGGQPRSCRLCGGEG
jgi:hypothetical protein